MNFLLKTDSYKHTHHKLYPEGCTNVYSYMEARKNSDYEKVRFFGLQYILKRHLTGKLFSEESIKEGKEVLDKHFGPGVFDESIWSNLYKKHGGKLPIRIRAVKEGTVVEKDNVLVTIENTDGEFPWLTNYIETLLMQVWYPTTVCTKSYHLKELILDYLRETSDVGEEIVNYCLQDFGFRGVGSYESSQIGGAAHLVNFNGTDTLSSLELIKDYYGGNEFGSSVIATEHSVMSSLGPTGEFKIVSDALKKYPTGIISIVADTYNIEYFVETMCIFFKEQINRRDGKFVIRPDSLRDWRDTPEEQMVWIFETLARTFGTTTNSKGFKSLNPKLGILWGDGIDERGINDILSLFKQKGYSTDCIILGMGGGLLQKLNRDTCSFAIKCSAQKINGEWRDVQKNPLDSNKKSKAGRLKLIKDNKVFKTVGENESGDDLLETVFEDGELVKEYTWEEIKNC